MSDPRCIWASLVVQTVKNLRAIHEVPRFDPWNGIPLQYSCLENSMDKEPGGLQSMGFQRVGHD